MLTRSPRNPSPAADRAIGATIRRLRVARGLSQEELSIALGLTFQQVQKYEKGVNAIRSTRLVTLAQALGTTVGVLLGEDGADAASVPQLSVPTVRLALAIEGMTAEQRAGVAAVVRAIMGEREGNEHG